VTEPTESGGGGLPSGAVAGTRWHKFHPATPFVKAAQMLIAAVLVTFLNSRGELLPVTIGAVVFAVVVGGYGVLAWRAASYAITSDSVLLHTGVLSKQQRHARLNRIQAVDVNQKLLPRLLGLASVDVEVAGGSGSNVSLEYLREADARALRAEILARASGLVIDDQPTAATATIKQTMTEVPVFVVTQSRVIGSVLLSTRFWSTAVVSIALLAIGSSGAAGIAMLLAVGAVVWAPFNATYGFTAAVSPDGIRLRHGLTDRRAQTIPPGRVHAVSIEQPLLWRLPGWWRVRANLAAYVGTSGQQDKIARINTLLPVGSCEEAVLALWLVLPNLGVENPGRLLAHALEGDGPSGGFLVAPRRTRWLDPFVWRRNGLCITQTAILMRSGRFTRVCSVVPHDRTQGLSIDQGPLERRFRVARFIAHSVPGQVRTSMRHLDADDALAVLIEQSDRAARARAVEPPEAWLARVTERDAMYRP